MNTRVIVLGASRYKFPQEGTGEIIEGCKIHYVEQNFTPEENSVGAIPQQCILEFGYFEGLKEVPGVYDAQFSVSLRGRKPTLKVTGFDFIEPFAFKQLALK